MNRTNKLVILFLVVACVIIVLPPIIHGYIYPSAGDDSAEHIKTISQVSLTNPLKSTNYLYAGQLLVGYPLVLIKGIFGVSIPVSFLWFSYLALIGVMLTYYYLFSRLFGVIGGVLSVIVGLFLSFPNMWAFSIAGTIFSVINLDIILMWLLYFAIKTIIWRKRSDAFNAGILTCLFAWFHVTGYYLPLVVLSLVLVYLLIIRYPNLKPKQGLLFLFCLSFMVIGIWVSSYTGWSLDPYRQIVDAQILAVLVVAGLLAIFLSNLKMNMYKGGLIVCLSFLVAIWTMPTWFSYTSAVKEADKQAIAYANSLSGSTFYTDSNSPPWLYGVFLNKRYEPNGQVYISRSEPMTLRTTQGYVGYWSPTDNVTKPPVNIEDSRKFTEGALSVYVAH